MLGLQWGDEGKGKIVDFLTPKYNVVARFQGGPNAGHTLEFDGIKHVLHQIPSGIFHADTINIIGNGVVLDPIIFKKEIEDLKAYNVDPISNLFISKGAQLILPIHRILDKAQEIAKGEKKIGSTLKGIGPAYQDKYARHGLRVGDVLQEDFEDRYKQLREHHLNSIPENLVGELDEISSEFLNAVDYLRTFQIVDTEYLINKELSNGAQVLCEGAQGTLLDVDFGSYPFVTSSNTISAGACSGLGLAPTKIGEVYGIFKAYCTRVGSGPFPTELFDAIGESLQKEGHEFGATTGRPRRCGWLDLPALKYSIMLNGVTQLFMMKADVLDSFEEIKVCTHYENSEGQTTTQFPGVESKDYNPVYRSFKGWQSESKAIEDYALLPAELKLYINFIEEEVGVPINLISVGPDRRQTIVKDSILV